jgi:hypothetical protein
MKWVRIGLLALAIVAATLFYPSQPVQAAVSRAVVTPGLDATWRPVASLTVRLTGGRKMYFYGKYTATNLGNNPVLQAAMVVCAVPGGRNVISPRSTTNHIGSRIGSQFIAVHALLTMPTTGTYTCSLVGRAARSGVDGEIDLLRVEAGTGTGLFISDIPGPSGMQWSDADDRVVAPATRAYVLRKSWTAADSAQTISLRVDPEFNEENTKLTAGIKTSVTVTQLNSAGTRCATPTVTPTKVVIVTPARHHAKVYFNLTGLPVNTAKACTRRFAVKVLVAVEAGGSPVRVYNGAYSNGIAFNGTVSR